MSTISSLPGGYMWSEGGPERVLGCNINNGLASMNQGACHFKGKHGFGYNAYEGSRLQIGVVSVARDSIIKTHLPSAAYFGNKVKACDFVDPYLQATMVSRPMCNISSSGQ